MTTIDTIFYILVLIFSVMIHEIAHGQVAYMLGDPTAKSAGRLTLNPLRHIDPFGSIILPALLVFSGAGFVIGWAKPVPYNPAFLRNKKWGTTLVASAGVIVNILVAVLFALIMRIVIGSGYASQSFLFITSIIVITNLVLALFNLIPIPPLDGSRILFSLLGHHGSRMQFFFERYSLILLIFFIFVIWPILSPLFLSLFSFMTGISLGGV